MLRTRKAFTMLELIVVIVILGILAAIAIPTFSTVMKKTRENSVKRTGESLGRETVAVAALDDHALSQADLTAATADLATGYTIGALTANNNGTPADLTDDYSTFTAKHNGYNITATVSIKGNVVTATTP